MAKAKKAVKSGTAAADKPKKSVLETELGKGEKLLWSHRPRPGAFALAHMRSATMGMPFLMIAMLWHGMIAKNIHLLYVDVFAWLFAAVGVAYLCVPLVAYMRGKVYVFYALTNQRLMILSLFPRHHVESFPIAAVNRVVSKDVNYGVGSLIIDAPGAYPKNPAKPRAGFYGVPYVTRVEDAFNVLKNPEAARAALQKKQAGAGQPSAPAAAKPATTKPAAPTSVAATAAPKSAPATSPATTKSANSFTPSSHRATA